MKVIVVPVSNAVQRTRVLLWIIWFISILWERSTGAEWCRASRLPPGVTISGVCSFRERESCRAKCERNGKTLWNRPVSCLPNGHWSATPLCRTTFRVTPMTAGECRKILLQVPHVGGTIACLKITETSQRPKCPALLNVTAMLGNCSREVGTTCRVLCGGGVGPATLRCLPYGRWSSVPGCVSLKPVTCPEPGIVKLINCSRNEGETCKFRCPDGKVAEEGVTCQPSGRWSNKTSAAFSRDVFLSRCSCPMPMLNDRVVALENCSAKKVGERCAFSCRPKHLAMIGHKTATCLKNLTWSPLPRCSNKKCPAPQLTSSLIFKEDCSSKLAGEECKLGCPGSSWLKENKVRFKCINGTHWSKLPHCICPLPPVLLEDVKFDEDCQRKKLGETCRLTCKKGLSFAGSNFMTCQSNGSWSVAPRCKRKSCTSPKLPSTLRIKGNCSSKAIGEKCPLECTNSSEKFEMVCLNNTKWSNYPNCSCPKPSLSKNMKLIGNCILKKPGEKCKVSCSGKDIFITCQNNSQWSHVPSCKKGHTCSQPLLPSYLQFSENCSSKGDEEMCKLTCRPGSKFIKDSYIRCLKGKWSEFPSCTCPKPKIREDLEMVGDCTSGKPGSSCKVRCKKNLSTPVTGSIICQSDTSWSPQPSCQSIYCQIPRPPPYLSLKNKCVNKTKGSVCEVSCKQKGSIVGQNFITCLDKLVWSPFPSCTCAEPKLGKDLIAKSSCKGMAPGKQCTLQCKSPLKLVGSSSIQCLQNSTWSALPICSADSACSVPKLPESVISTEICSNKKPGDNCALKCKGGGEMLGNKFIKCLNVTHWSKTPACACPKPTLKNGLILVTDCSAELPGSKCYLKCMNNYNMEGKNFMICQENTKWSDPPKCSKIVCNKPVLKPFLVAAGNCASKVPGQECPLQCREGGMLIGESKIKCLNKTHWSEIPECGCPSPVLGDDLKIDEVTCNRKKVGKQCKLRCKGTKTLVGGKPHITCQKDLKWSSPPMCIIQTCINPLSTSKILKPKSGDNCFDKVINDTCKLECMEGGKLIGSETIKCLNRTHWSSLPDCSCPKPDLPKYLKFDEDCSNKGTGKTCKVSCKESKKLVGSSVIRCDKNKKWSSFPLCQTIFCPEPLIPREILAEHPFSCASKQPGETCNLMLNWRSIAGRRADWEKLLRKAQAHKGLSCQC